MSGLPPALAPWAAPLAPFAPDLALALGKWARRLAPALGPMPGRRAGAGEPDGFADLSRRGQYAQLLLSEWLLADELPDEFLRRAAAGEHLFLARARRERAAGQRSIALLDAGPGQLGAPRLAQLAVLVVLSARAAAAGAAFEWGVLQRRDLGLAEGFSPDLARRFLEARSDDPVSPEALTGWLELLPPAAARDDLWLVGGPGLLRAPAPAEASRLLLDDVAEPDARQVRVVRESRGVARRELVLDLPPPADCVRLLRDPFGTERGAPVRLAERIVPEAGLVFHPGGHRLALRLRGSHVLDVPIPNSPRAQAGRRRTAGVEPGTVALGWDHRNRLVTVTVRGMRVEIDRTTDPSHGSRRAVPGPGVPMPAAPAPGERFGRCVLRHEDGRTRAWFSDAAGALYVAELGSKLTPGRLEVACPAVADLAANRSLLAYLPRDAAGLGLVVHTGTPEWFFPLGKGTGRGFLGAGKSGVVVATEHAQEGLWALRSAHGPPASLGRGRSLRPLAGGEVVGVAAATDRGPGLVVLEQGRRTLSLLDAHALRPIHHAAADVVAVAVSPSGASIAYTTAPGGLVVVSTRSRAVLLELAAGGAA